MDVEDGFLYCITCNTPISHVSLERIFPGLTRAHGVFYSQAVNIDLTEDDLFDEKLFDLKLPENILYQYRDVFCKTCTAEIGRFIVMVMTEG